MSVGIGPDIVETAPPQVARRVIIHAGIHRTGSSSLQLALAANRQILAARGFAYPLDLGPEVNAAHPPSPHHARLATAIRNRQITVTELKEYLENASVDCHTIILSSEEFCGQWDTSIFLALADVFQIQAIFYLRRQDDWFNSWYNLNVAWPFDRVASQATPREFLHKNTNTNSTFWLNYFDLLERWSASIGRKNVIVRVHERSQVTSVIDDFLACCGLSDVRLPAPRRVNASVPTDHLMLLRRIHLMRHPPELWERIREEVARLPSHRTSNVFPVEVRAAIVARYREQNAKVARRYLGRADRALFLDPPFKSDDSDMDGLSSVDEALLSDFLKDVSRPPPPLSPFNPRRWITPRRWMRALRRMLSPT